MSVENPFPFEGTITPREGGDYGADLPVTYAYVSDTGSGDVLLAAADRARSRFGTGTSVQVRFTGDRYCENVDYELHGPVEEVSE